MCDREKHCWVEKREEGSLRYDQIEVLSKMYSIPVRPVTKWTECANCGTQKGEKLESSVIYMNESDAIKDKKVISWKDRHLTGNSPGPFCDEGKHYWIRKSSKRESIHVREKLQGESISANSWVEWTECFKCGARKGEPDIALGFAVLPIILRCLENKN